MAATATMLHHGLSAVDVSPSVEISGNTDDWVWERRRSHRLAGVLAGPKSSDFITMLAKLSAGELPQEETPIAPDPDGRSISKRQWEKSVAKWRRAIRYLVASCS